jgi:hypothetical protein
MEWNGIVGRRRKEPRTPRSALESRDVIAFTALLPGIRDQFTAARSGRLVCGAFIASTAFHRKVHNKMSCRALLSWHVQHTVRHCEQNRPVS